MDRVRVFVDTVDRSGIRAGVNYLNEVASLIEDWRKSFTDHDVDLITDLCHMIVCALMNIAEDKSDRSEKISAYFAFCQLIKNKNLLVLFGKCCLSDEYQKKMSINDTMFDLVIQVTCYMSDRGMLGPADNDIQVAEIVTNSQNKDICIIE